MGLKEKSMIAVGIVIVGLICWGLSSFARSNYNRGRAVAEAQYLINLDSIKQYYASLPPSIEHESIYITKPGSVKHDTLIISDTVIFTPDSIWRPKFIWHVSYSYTTGYLEGITVDGKTFNKSGIGSFVIDGDDKLKFESSDIPVIQKPKTRWIGANLYLMGDVRSDRLNQVDYAQIGLVPGVVLLNTVRIGVGGGFIYQNERFNPAAFGSVVVRLAGKW